MTGQEHIKKNELWMSQWTSITKNSIYCTISLWSTNVPMGIEYSHQNPKPNKFMNELTNSVQKSTPQ